MLILRVELGFRLCWTTEKPAAMVTTKIVTIMMTTWVDRRCHAGRMRAMIFLAGRPFAGCFRSVTTVLHAYEANGR